jgi:endonuclease/exonuclease/phosphatase family metal-dependent hydrolase
VVLSVDEKCRCETLHTLPDRENDIVLKGTTLRIIIPLALTVTFGFQLLRMWLSGVFYYGYEVAHASYSVLIGLAVLVFGLAFFAGTIQRKLGVRAIAIVGGGVALMRLIEQINSSPAIDLIVTSIGVALFLMFISISCDTLRANELGQHFPTSIVLGLSIDTAIKGAFGTIDLSWIGGLWPIVIVGVLAALQLGLIKSTLTSVVGQVRQAQGQAQGLGLARGWPLLALGPFFFLQMQMFQNIGYVATVTNLTSPIAFEIIVFANTLGLFVASAVYDRVPRRAWTWALVVGLILIVVTLPIEGDPLAVLEVMAGQVAASIGLALMSHMGQRATPLRLPIPDLPLEGRWAARRTTGALRGGKALIVVGISMVLLMLMVIGYYIGHIVRLPVPDWTFALLASIIITVAMVASVMRADQPRTPDRAEWTAGIIGLGLIILPLVTLIGWREPSPSAGSMPLRIMSYNLHSGFDLTGRLALEEVAQAIESEHAGVIGLQEVSRGWLIDGSVDMVSWLSQRLNLPYVWGPTADPLWGNAILSRYPIRDIQLYPMPNNDVVRPMRGFIVATIEVGAQPLRVMVTHLHHVGDDSPLRVAQVQTLLGLWASRPATIVLGDLNARPASIEMALMRSAGLIDSFAETGQAEGFTFGSINPDRRIDYIYHSPDLVARDFHVNPSTASDHFGIAVTIAR